HIPNLNSCPKLFADDTNLFVSGKNLSDLFITGQNVLNKLYDWMSANKLSINYNKSHYIISPPDHQYNSISLPDLLLNNNKISNVSTTKFLGIHIDKNLSCRVHILELCISLRKFITIFYKLCFIFITN